ncbi:hypothetical protein Hypma_016467 [Hypsizygus marmoreus]|uniref:Uncharacterized protein n=1 Tax=Hypsizygus marmoreus TaxID=39966 RepID=A0A369IXZ9_HYPMA|nr:hypothetical protein Hypma_016467 [Hypsizygus marmoreus]
MPTTRHQAALQEEEEKKSHETLVEETKKEEEAEIGDKRDVKEVTKTEEDEPPNKRPKAEPDTAEDVEKHVKSGKGHVRHGKEPEHHEPAHHEKHHAKHTKEKKHVPQTGTIERGHVYFFYRPRVQIEEAHSLDDVRNLHMLLVPRPPEFTIHAHEPGKTDIEEPEEAEMHILEEGADVIPASEALDEPKKHYRVVTIGKKHLPDPEHGGAGKGPKETFWATVTSVGDDLHALEKGLGPQTYETKTRGSRHEEPARLAARGAYAIVNNLPHVPSARTTHFGYHISHPSEIGEVQKELGISTAASFVLQVKNPLAPAATPQQAHMKGADYPEYLLHGVFAAGSKGRESYGLRFASCETPELLDYKGAQLLFIAARSGDEGLEVSLGEGRGKALHELEEKEGQDESVKMVFRELAMDSKTFPAEPLKGHWI